MESVIFAFKLAAAGCVSFAIIILLLMALAMRDTARNGIGSLNGKLRSNSVWKKKG